MGLESRPTLKTQIRQLIKLVNSFGSYSSGNHSKLLATTPVLKFNKLTITNTCLLPVTEKL